MPDIDDKLFYTTPSKNKQSKLKKSIIPVFNQTTTTVNKPPEIQEMDNCIVVDDFLNNIDVFEESLLKFPCNQLP